MKNSYHCVIENFLQVVYPFGKVYVQVGFIALLSKPERGRFWSFQSMCNIFEDVLTLCNMSSVRVSQRFSFSHNNLLQYRAK
jgi:hypothetical protein